MTHVVVVGGGITGMTTAFTLRELGVEVTLVEADTRLGGKILTTEVAGVRIDAGPDAFLVREPHVTDLARQLHLDDALVAPATGQASLWIRGALRPLPRRQYLGVPLDLDELEQCGIVSDSAIARARRDLSAPDDAPAGDESVGSLIRRRLGDEVMDCLVGPLLGGINAGDPDQLSLAAGVPQLHGATGHDASLVRSITEHLRVSPRDPDAPIFLTHPDGLGRLVDTLATRLGDIVRTDWPVRRIEHLACHDHGDHDHGDHHAWQVIGDDEVLEADVVVVTTPAFAAAHLLGAVAPEAAAMLAAIEYASVVLVTFAYHATDVEPFDGSGFLVPQDEGLLMSACSWASSKWRHLDALPVRFLRVSAGRASDTRAMSLDDDQLVATLRRELAVTMAIDSEPIEVRITRWPDSFPQYRPGHLERIAGIDETLSDEAPGIIVTGAAMRGLGLPACVHQARVAAYPPIEASQGGATRVDVTDTAERLLR